MVEENLMSLLASIPGPRLDYLSIFTLVVWEKPFSALMDRSKRILDVGKALARINYDVVCLQGLWKDEDFNTIRDLVMENFPFIHYFESGVIGSGLCTLSKYPIVNTFFHEWRMNGYPHMIDGDWYAGKGIGLTQIEVKGLIINIYNAHVNARHSEKNDSYLLHQVAQGFETAKFIKLTFGGAACALLVGDLNRSIYSPSQDIAYRLLRTLANMRETHQRAEDSVLSKKYCSVLYRPTLGYSANVLSHEFVLPSETPDTQFSFSDHKAVLVNFQIKRSKSANPEPVDLNELEDLVREINDICELGMDLAWKNCFFFLVLQALAQFLLMLMAYFQPPMTFTSLFIASLLIIIFIFALFMTTIWQKSERENIAAIQSELVAFETDINLLEYARSNYDLDEIYI